jgi:hypothetical protein
MPAFKDRLSESERRHVVSYLERTFARRGGRFDAGSPAYRRLQGQVSRLDRATGRLTLWTEAGEAELRVPPDVLEWIRDGDRVEVQLIRRPAAGALARHRHPPDP